MTVPYVNQLGNSPNNDCGPACAMMLALAAGKAGPHTITDWSKRFDAADDGTTAEQVRAMLSECGLATTVGFAAAYPYIALVSYQLLPPSNRMVTNKEFAHWIVRLSDTTYHDPYHQGSNGANKSADKAALDKAEISTAARTGLVIKLGGEPLLDRKTKLFLRLRSTPTDTIGGNILGDVAKGTIVRPLEAQADAAGRGRWLRVAMPVPNMVRDENVTVPLTLDGWLAEWLTDPVAITPPVVVPPPTSTPSPVPPTAGDFRLGLNVLSNVGPAMEEARRGCTFFLVMDSFMGATQIKQAYPKATVIVRRWWQSRPTVEQCIAGLEGASSPGLIYTGTNEADVMGQSGQGLIDRAKFDVEVARRVRQISGATYAAGTFSVGCPDFNNEADCKIIREIYAPAYNSGLIALDMHLYSPTMAHVYKPDDHIWYERRWEFLFTKCGFDPAVRAIYCSECGVDEGGVGGFSAHGASDQAVADWCKAYIALQSAPLVIGGKSYASPIRGGAIFQLGGNGDQRWAGYDVTKYLPVLRKFY
jgi:hypothetical protein